MKERYRYIISSEDTEISIKEILKHKIGISSRLLRRLKEGNCVFLDGKETKLYEKGTEGACITILFPDESSNFQPEAIPINVIYEDSDLLVINKQPGCVVHPTKGHQSNTIANGVMNHMINMGETYKIRFINRLDMNTSGVLLIGKNSYSQADFTKQAGEGRVKKAYLAIVKGLIPEDCGIINLPIGKPHEDTIKRTVIYNGYPSMSRYEIIERYKRYTLLRVFLETGRTHQIRVHLSHMGYPVAGDILYGGEMPELINRQALHAEYLSFQHPAGKGEMCFKAPLPEDMRDLIIRLR